MGCVGGPGFRHVIPFAPASLSVRTSILFIGASLAAGAAASSLTACELVFPDVVRDSGASGDAKAPNDSSALDAGPSLCGMEPADSGIVFCDGFEHELDAWTVVMNGGGIVDISSAEAYRGSHSLHTTLPGMATTVAMTAEVNHRQDWPQPLFARFFALLPSPSAPAYATSLLILNTTSPTIEGIETFLTGGNASIALSTFSSLHSANSNVPVPDRWICFELEVDGSNATLTVSDASEPLTVSFPVATEGLLLDLGLAYATPTPATPSYEGLFDEIAVGSKPISCAE
jgi:hypothetical protein